MPSVENNVAELSGVVGDVMTKQFVAVLANVSASETAEKLSAAGVRHALVVDAEQRVLGVVSQRDIFAHFMSTLNEQGGASAAAGERAPWEIGSLVKIPPITVSPEVPLSKAGVVLSNYKVDCVPVVDENKCLIGSLSVVELLRHIIGNLDSDAEQEISFQFFTPEHRARPQTPAFFRRANGALVIPVSCLENPGGTPDFAVLGYDPNGGRIAVKFVSDKNAEGARKVQRDNDNIVIPANDFVARFDIKLHISAFDVTRHRQLNCLVLTPKQITAQATTPALAEAKK